MNLEEVSQVWFVQTTKGKSYLILTTHKECWQNLPDAIKHGDSLYGINTSDPFEVSETTLVNLIERICEYDKLTFANQRWEECADKKPILLSFTIQFLDEDISSKDICCPIKEVYKSTKGK